MSFYGGNQNGGQPGSNPHQQMGRQPTNPGLQNVQQVLTPQLFNLNVNPGQLHNLFNEHGSSQNSLQLNAAAAAAAANQSILLQPQQPQSFPVNLINEQLGVGVGQLISSATVSQSQMQGLPISMSSALNFSQAIVHGQTAQSQQNQAQSQQQKQRVFTGTVTKVHDNFGFIDEEVFFQMGVVKGPILPKEGDRVLVEADFNNNMPFKWNATRVQIVNIGGGISSSLNNLPNISTSQAQHQHMGFNTSVGMQKQSSAPPPPVLTSQPSNARPHGAQPVTIVSNPHSVYSGGNNPRNPRAGVGVPGPPPVSPMVTQQRGDPKRPLPHMPLVPEPPTFLNSGPVQGLLSSDMDRGRERTREVPRERSRDRSREHVRDRSRDRARGRSSERSRDRGRDRSREKVPRNRSRSRERVLRDRSRDRNMRGNSRDRVFRERSPERGSNTRPRSRSRERDRNARERSAERRDKSKRERTPDKHHERSRDTRDKETSKERKKSASPSSRSSKDDSKRDGKSRNKDKPAEKGKSGRDRSPSSTQGPSQSSERSKRSRSRESVRTDRGHGPTERSRSRSSSPRRKASRPAPRYAVEIPKFSLDTKDINVKEIQRRYPNLYVPSDFFLAKSTWMDTFPLHEPFEMSHASPVHIVRKGVHKIDIPNSEVLEDRFKDIPDILEPADASFTFKAKVMIPSMSNLETIYRKSCGVGDNGSDSTDTPQHIDRLISFIVGMKTSKHEVMALGGPWSPSLDGPNPQSDPHTLINTAIRSVRALTGVNLSRCKHWYRFMELYYKRSNCLETVVFYLPDVWSCLPGTKEWGKLKSVYKYALYGEKLDIADINSNSDKESTQNGVKVEASEAIIKESSDLTGVDSLNETTESVSKIDVDTNLQEDDAMNNSGLLVIDEAASPARDDGSLEDPRMDSALQITNAGDLTGTDPDSVMQTEDDKSVEMDSGNMKPSCDNSPPKLEAITAIASTDEKDTVASVLNGGENVNQPTHYSNLTPKSMTVAQLKDELIRRNLSPKGLKSQLLTRLLKALKEEEALELETQEKAEETQTVNVEIKRSQEDATDETKTQETKALESNGPVSEQLENEHDIRIVNPSLILETQDDEMSVEEGESKDEQSPDDASPNSTDYASILSAFPPDTFPIIKPGMKEEEVKMWERRYALPKNPRVLLYPSLVAKSGNFDCLTMTLGLMRDYRIIDKKEENFEVSLFSEFFHEMLQRDFAFRIYREVVSEAGKPSVDENTNSVEKDTGTKDDKKDEKDGSEPASKKRKLSNNSASVSTVVSKKVTDPYLLLSFTFFDVTRCGYITETDLEDLCGCIGIGLTRAQIRKVVQKVVYKGTLYYRKWTERSEKPKTRSDDEIRVLSQGNKCYFPVFVLQDNGPSSISKSEKSMDGDDSKEAIMAVVNGKEVDVKKLLAQLDKCEKDLTVAESSLNVMKNSLNEAKSQVMDLKKSNESLKDELAKIKESLKKSENTEKSAKENVEVFKRSTERFLERIKDLVKFPTTSGKDKSAETSSKDTAKAKDKPNAEQKEKSKSCHDPSQSECNQTASKESSNTVVAEDSSEKTSTT